MSSNVIPPKDDDATWRPDQFPEFQKKRKDPEVAKLHSFIRRGALNVAMNQSHILVPAKRGEFASNLSQYRDELAELQREETSDATHNPKQDELEVLVLMLTELESDGGVLSLRTCSSKATESGLMTRIGEARFEGYFRSFLEALQTRNMISKAIIA